MILVLIILTVILVWGAIALHESYDYELIGAVLSTIAGFAIFFILLVWVISYMNYKSEIVEYGAIKQTIETSRTNDISSIERATLTTKIIEINQSIATSKYWNNYFFLQDFIPDDYTKLEPLQ